MRIARVAIRLSPAVVRSEVVAAGGLLNHAPSLHRHASNAKGKPPMKRRGVAVDERLAQTALSGNLYQPRSAVFPEEDYNIAEANPLKHTYADVGKYFALQGTGSAKLATTFPGGLAGDLQQEFDVTGSTSMCVRPSGVFLVQNLEHWRQTSARSLAAAGSAVKDVDAATPYVPPMLPLPVLPAAATMHADSKWAGVPIDPSTTPVPAYRMLTGPGGIGKSSLLNYAVAYARRNGWIVVFVPDSLHLMRKGLVLTKSKRRPGMVDQPDLALQLLRDTLAAHADALGRVPQRRKYAVFRYLPREADRTVSAQREALRREEDEARNRLKAQSDAAGTAWDPASFFSKYDDESDVSIDRSAFTLRHLAEWGLAHPAAATDALVDLLEELRLVTEFPVLVAVDGHNLLYEAPTIYPQDGKLLEPHQLSVLAALQCLGPEGFKQSSHGMQRGLYLTTVTQRHGKPMRLFDVAAVKPAYRLRVPEATRAEIASQLQHYHRSGRFLMVSDEDAVDAFAVDYYRTLCSGRMREIFEAAMYRPL